MACSLCADAVEGERFEQLCLVNMCFERGCMQGSKPQTPKACWWLLQKLAASHQHGVGVLLSCVLNAGTTCMLLPRRTALHMPATLRAVTGSSRCGRCREQGRHTAVVATGLIQSDGLD
jgi:hypothetical protein